MYERTQLLIGEKKLENLKSSSVMVAGLGGVGGMATEMIARAGVGNIIIVDNDVVSQSNINRQILALHSTIGRCKTEVMCERLMDINPEINLTVISEYLKDDLTPKILDEYHPNYLIDAIDTLSPKVFLLAEAYNRHIPTVSSMGSGGKLDASKVEVTDISKTYNCPLASHIRKALHRMEIRKGIRAVFSPEKVDKALIIEERTENKRTTVGTISYMPNLFGLMAASEIINMIIDRDNESNDRNTL